MSVSARRWEALTGYSNAFTCYSAAVATWAAAGERDWRAAVNTELWLRITESADGLFGFAYFQPTLRASLGLVRRGADDPDAATRGVLEEIERTGRVIVAGDGFNLPWHVAHGRVHAPHWFVLAGDSGGIEVMDPFACRNELGVQESARRTVSGSALQGLQGLQGLLRALPGGDPVHRLREVLALGDETDDSLEHRFQWFVCGKVAQTAAPAGLDGPDAVLALARHFRERGGELSAYSQADDIWSIARHRAFMCRCARERADAEGDPGLAAWVDGHAAPLATRWGHMAPLLMQAILALRVGRAPSSSVPDTLERLAELERLAAIPSESTRRQ